MEKKDGSTANVQEDHLTDEVLKNLKIVQERLGVDDGRVNLALDTSFAKRERGPYPCVDQSQR